jgi:hypothetical protein
MLAFMTVEVLAAPAITLSTASGTVSSTLTVSGTGFNASTTGTVTFGSGSAFATSYSATSDNTGAFSTSFSVPTVPGGTYTIIATLGTSASASFTVRPTVTLSTNSAHVGDLIDISGTGFSASLTASIAYDGTTLTRVTTNANGSFDITLVVPHSVYGTHTVTASDGIFNASTILSVTQFITVSPAFGRVGSSVTVFGSGFRGNGAVTINFDDTQVTSTVSDAYGDFSVSFAVPVITGGTRSVIASDGTVSASAAFSALPTLRISASSGYVGASVMVSGGAFSSNATVTIIIDDIFTLQATTDVNGSFNVSLTVPAGPGGARTLTASDGTYSTSTTFTVLSSIKVNPASGKVSSQAMVTGTGFGSGTSVAVSFDNTLLATANADSNGSFSVSLTVPAGPGGARTLTASDGTYSTSTTFTVLSSIKVNPASGKVSSQAMVTGTGFGSGTSVAVSFDNTLLATANADSNGSFRVNINIPPSPAGSHVISSNDGTLVANSTFTTVASISVSPDSGPMGIRVTITGTGFAATGAINIQMGNIVVRKTTADGKGSFNQEILVPQLYVGNYNLTVTDETNAVSAPFLITTSFSINPTYGHVSSNVTVSGAGFNGTVNVRYDDLVTATATAGDNGTFSAVFTVPTSIHGPHIISVNDATNMLQSTFTMESVPPSVPALLQPQAGARQDTQLTLTWTPVTDPSGVVYTMQIATDASFTHPILEKDTLTATRYKLFSGERLPTVSKDTPYYWRVKAVDLAQNEGDWSNPSSFYVSLLAPWAMWSLIGQGVLAATLLLVWLGKRRCSETK